MFFYFTSKLAHVNYQDIPSEHEKKQFLRLLLKLSAADNQYSNEEMVYILQVGMSSGLDEETIRSLPTDQSDLVIDFPKSEQDRMSMLYYLLFLMKIDKHVDAEEEKLIYHYGFKLGFSEAMLRDMIELIKSKVDQNIPPVEMLTIIKKYLN